MEIIIKKTAYIEYRNSGEDIRLDDEDFCDGVGSRYSYRILKPSFDRSIASLASCGIDRVYQLSKPNLTYIDLCHILPIVNFFYTHCELG